VISPNVPDWTGRWRDATRRDAVAPDAMVGHRSPRDANFGWAAARLDDAANLVPARVTAGLVTGRGACGRRRRSRRAARCHA
jgi:cobalamin biosynthesis protein CobD/CbiB